MLLHELAHVDPHHRGLVVEEERGQRLGQLGLADTGRPEEHEGAKRPVRVLQPGPRATHRRRDGFHRLKLADDALAELRFHAQQLVALTLEHLVDGNPGPARDDLSDHVGGDSLRGQRAGLLRTGGFQRSELLFQRRDDAIGKFARALEFTGALRLLELGAGLLELTLDALGLAKLVFFGAPSGSERGGFFLKFSQFALELAEAILRRSIGFATQRLLLDAQTDDLAIDAVEFLRLGIDLHPEARRGLIHQVDRLVRQETIGDVAVRERRRRDER